MTEEQAEKKPEWVTIKPAEIEKIVIELAKHGESPAKIGIILRDKHGVPKAKALGKRISEILDEAKVSYPTEKQRVDKKVTVLKEHIKNNKHDYSAKKSLSKTLWLTLSK